MRRPEWEVLMQPQNPLIVRTAAYPTSSIGNRLGDMRTWLDRNSIDLLRFATVTLSVEDVAFDVQFRDLENATLFRAAFGSTAAPSV